MAGTYIPLIKRTKWVDLSNEHKKLRETVESDLKEGCNKGNIQPIMLQGAFGIGKSTTLYYLFHYGWEVLKTPTFYMPLAKIVDAVKKEAESLESGKVQNNQLSRIINSIIKEQIDKLRNSNWNDINDIDFPDFKSGDDSENPSLNQYLEDFIPVTLDSNDTKESEISKLVFSEEVIRRALESTTPPILLVDEFESKFYELKRYVESSGGGILRELFDQVVQTKPFLLVIGNGPASGYEVAKEKGTDGNNDSETAANRRLKTIQIPFPTVALLKRKFMKECANGYVNFIWWMSRCRPGHIQKLWDAIDYSITACSTCKYKAIINTFDENSKPYADACASCASCPHKTLIQKNVYKKIYHNEKNRYGYRPMLKANAIKLFLLLHFYHPDNNGIVYNLEACELASVIGCNVRTVWNNLKVLEEYTYISYSKNEYGLINVILNDYENYYLPANKGGRGFLVMSKELLTKLNSTDSLVSLRIFIRELLSLDSPELKGVASVDYKNIRDIRNTLPSYCKPSVIKAKLTKNSDIFNVTFKDDVVRFEIDKAYIPKNQKAYVHEEYVGILQNFIWEFNQNVAYVNSGETVSAKFSSFFNIKTSVASYKLMKLTDIEIDDIASLSLHYSYEIVMNALSVVYKEYYMYEKTINNLAGLMSTIIRAQFNNLKKAA